MINKLVFIINGLKVPKIKKILLYEMKFLVPNYSYLQNLWLGGYRPQIPIFSVLCPQLNLLNPLPLNKIPGYATAYNSLPWIRARRLRLCRYHVSGHLDISLGIAVVSGETLQILAYQLEHTPSESDAPYWVEEEVYAEVGVVQKHEVLL